MGYISDLVFRSTRERERESIGLNQSDPREETQRVESRRTRGNMRGKRSEEGGGAGEKRESENKKM